MKNALTLLIIFVATFAFAQTNDTLLKQPQRETQPLVATKNSNNSYIGLTYHNYFGRLGNHLGNGIGIKLRCNIVREENWGIGLTGMISFNQRKQKFERDSATANFYSLGMIGMSYIHRLYQNKNHDLNLQADLCLVVGSYNQAPQGASIGVLFNYAYHKKVEYRTIDFWDSKIEGVVADCINFHAGIHGILAGAQMEGSGFMVEAGIAHRFAIYHSEDTPEQKAAKKAYREQHKPLPYEYIPPPKPFVPQYEDFESIEKGGSWSMQLGMAGDVSLGNLSDTYGTGIGANMSVSYRAKNGWGGGLDMSFIENRLNQNLPTPRYFQNTTTFRNLIGAVIQKKIIEADRNYLIAQVGVYGINQNTGVRVKQKDTISYVIYRGFSPAFRLDYGIQLGKKSIEDWANTTVKPMVFVNYVNLHAAVRHISLDNRPIPSGFQVEVGVSYKFSMTAMQHYQLKAD